MLRLLSRHGGRDAIGARVRLRAGDLELRREVRGSASYLSQGDLRIHFGLGEHSVIDEIEIRWPDGSVQMVPGGELQMQAPGAA